MYKDKTVKDCEYLARNYKQLGYNKGYAEYYLSEQIVFSDNPETTTKLFDLIDEIGGY